jgi:GNAT superfamily N-acetyltransferase
MSSTGQGASEAITIRAATSADLEVIMQHRRKMFRDDLGSSEAALDQMERTSRPFIERGLREGWYYGWLAMVNREVAAGVGMIIHDWATHPLWPQLGQRAYILNVYTEPNFRRRGLARKLMHEAIACAKREGLAVVWLHATERGRPLYEQLGFGTTNEMKLVLR